MIEETDLLPLTEEEIIEWDRELIEEIRASHYSFKDYQETITDFAVYPEKNTGGVAALSYCGLGLGLSLIHIW